MTKLDNEELKELLKEAVREVLKENGFTGGELPPEDEEV